MTVDKKTTKNAPLIVIVGPTASGKSAVAMQIAEQFGGEIIAADSRTVYKDMDIGTAKPTPDDRQKVPHWGLDIATPGDTFTAADFKRYATEKIKEIRARGNIPMLVGGTGLYVDGVVFDYQFGAPNPALRKELEQLSIEELQERCRKSGIPLPENSTNRRHLQRVLEQGVINTDRQRQPLENTLIVGIATDPQELRERITTRAEEFFEGGMIEEAVRLGEAYGWDSEAMTGNAYPLVKLFLDGEIGEVELKERFVTSDWRLTKRQRTWLKRNSFIHWKSREQAFDFIAKHLEGAGCVRIREYKK
ncbi:tRNA dimethylallyltransferase [Candidatus Saccharibacteria bacterium TM7i]|nr:tRNA dimethylallyltransferase [Candidatus Saccharibacteria bacterium TM7i]